MTDELIKIEENYLENGTKPAVSARELYEYLEVKSKFTDWMRSNIERAFLRKSFDYEVFHSVEKNIQGVHAL